MVMLDADFQYIRDFIYQKAAIVLEQDKGYLVETRLQPIVQREGFDSLSAMVAQLRLRPMNGLHWQVVEAMTTNETYFFRDVQPFEILRKSVLPELIKKRAAERQLNFWCAAASSGQEPYTVMIILREHFPELSQWKVNFIASDISKEMIERCREGCYSQLEVSRGLPAPLLVKYFHKIGAQWRVHDHLRGAIDFRQINLVEAWPLMPHMDIVFIRNVLIYFDLQTKKNIMARLNKLLRPDGCLFLGGAETTLNVDDSFQRIQIDKTAYYRVRGS
jgi:chemotaxis protein methyltransferase CheR